MIVHENMWWWGISENIIVDGGVGMVEIQFDYDMPNTGFIKGLSVLEEHRRKGIGKRLLEACAERALARNMKFLQLEVEFDSGWLKEWYERLGFVVLSREKCTYLMIKNL